MNRLINVFILLGLTASCANLFENRTFIDEMDRDSDGVFVPGQDFRVSPGDNGQAYRSHDEIMKRTPAGYRDKDEYLYRKSIQGELYELEDKLEKADYQQYMADRAYLPSNSEKIYYLKLNSYERQDYIRSRRVQARPTQLSRGLASVDFIQSGMNQNGELYLGMRKDEVMSAWGSPHRVDIAGDPRNENERWLFYQNGSMHHVYFEQGQVQGWSLGQ